MTGRHLAHRQIRFCWSGLRERFEHPRHAWTFDGTVEYLCLGYYGPRWWREHERRKHLTVYLDARDWWIGYYRGPLPTLVIRWPRRR